MRNIYFIFPKMSAYEFKSTEVQMQIETEAKKYYDLCKKAGLRVKCFAEDILASQLFKEYEDISWVSVLSEGDASYFSGELPIGDSMLYDHKSKTKVDNSYLSKAKSKFPIAKQSKSSIRDRSSDEYMTKRLNIMHNRLRYAANAVLEDSPLVVVFISKGNDYCKVADSYVGDGKFTIEIELEYLTESFVYSGIPLPEEQAWMAIRSIA